jgi:hypothetical protein
MPEREWKPWTDPHIRRIKEWDVELADALRAPGASTYTVRVVRQLMEQALREGRDPRDFANVLKGFMTPGRLKERLLSQLARAAHTMLREHERAKGRSDLLASTVLSAAVNNPLDTPRFLKLAPVLAKVARAGHETGDIAHLLVHYGPRGKAWNRENLSRLAQLMAESSQAKSYRQFWLELLSQGLEQGLYHSGSVRAAGLALQEMFEKAHPEDEELRRLLRPAVLRGIGDPRRLRMLAEHAKLARQGGRKWSPAALVVAALSAYERIGDLEKTLALQREIIERSGGKYLPTAKLTLRYWRAKPGKREA